jgi:hypothetical protein
MSPPHDSPLTEKSARTRTDTRTTTGAFRGTDGSNPLPSSRESRANLRQDSHWPLGLSCGRRERRCAHLRAPPVERWIERSKVVRAVQAHLWIKGCCLRIKSVKLGSGLLETEPNGG